MPDPHASRPADPTTPPGSRPESYGRILARPLVVLGLLVGLTVYHAWPRPNQPEPDPIAPRVVAQTPAPPVPVAAPPSPEEEPAPAPAPAPPAPPAPRVDQAALAKAEAALDAASRERAHADARLADARRSLELATIQTAKELADGKKIATTVRDPSARIAAASTRGGFLKGDRDRLKKELAAIAQVPQSKPHALMAKSAVAKPTEGTEYHFEVRGSRVSFVDIDRLVEMVKSDARLRLRSGGNRGQLAATVGPVGSFRLKYEMARAMPEALAEMLGGASETTYNLVGWEILSDSPNRGEPFATTRSPSSSYARAIHRLNPDRDTITMWIYPDGFAMYRQLRDDLHAQGFLVAARPLPDGTSIKGSPAGSLSAGQ